LILVAVTRGAISALSGNKTGAILVGAYNDLGTVVILLWEMVGETFTVDFIILSAFETQRLPAAVASKLPEKFGLNRVRTRSAASAML